MALTTEEWERLVRRYRAVIIQNAIDDAKHLVNVDWEKDEDDGDMIMIDWDSPSAKQCVALFKEKKKEEKAKIPKGFRGFLEKEPWYARYK